MIDVSEGFVFYIFGSAAIPPRETGVVVDRCSVRSSTEGLLRPFTFLKIAE